MRVSLWFAAAAMVVVLPTMPARAAPRGSYMQSCQDVRDDGRTLSAQCRDRSKRYQYSTLRYRDCRGEISNQDGQLTCTGGRAGGGWGGGGGNGRPGSDWNQGRPGSGGGWDNGRPGNGGGWDNGRPGNGGGWDNGRPGNGWGGNASLPGGSWARSCRNSGMRGSMLMAECKGQRDWQDAQLDMRSCRSGRAGNRDGQLVCE
jgi:hypothetical protein